MRATIHHQSRVLRIEQTCDASARCPICHSDGPRHSVGIIQQDPRIAILRCEACQGCSASRMPKAEVLSEYYSTYYDKDQETRGTFDDIGRLARHIIRSAGRSLLAERRSLDILDFGGGDGTLCAEIARHLKIPARAVVVEHCEPRRHEVDAFELRHAPDLIEAPGQYDLVIASAVLEHIPELKDVLETLLQKVQPGGFFYARTPYVLPFMKLLGKLDFTYPGHVHDLGPAFWLGITKTFALDAEIVSSRPSVVETGFRQAFVRTLAAYVLKTPALLEVKLTGGRKRPPIWPFVGGWEIVLRKRSG